MASVVVAGWPEVWAVDIFQPSNGEPGTVLVDTLVSNEDVITELPLETSLTITCDEGTFVWNNLKVSKKPRQYGRYMRTVFQDERYKFRDTTVGTFGNIYDCNGDIYPETEATLEVMWDVITSISGLNIQYSSLPSIKPQAAWRGRKLNEVVNDLLVTTGCRMVYRPSDQTYQVSPGTTGTPPSIADRVFRQPPFMGYSNLVVKTHPKTFEAVLACTAGVRDSTGTLVAIDSSKGIQIFSNFAGIADAAERSSYQRTAYRIWVPDAISGKMMLGRRAFSVGPGDTGPIYASPYIKKSGDHSMTPSYHQLVQQVAFEAPPLSLNMSGFAFQSEHPHAMVKDDGSLDNTASVVCAYHNISGYDFVRDEEQVSLPGVAGEVVVVQDWIRPVQSSEADVSGSSWTSVLSGVANAIAMRYSGTPQHVEYPSIINHGGGGQIGGVRYTAMAGQRGGLKTSLAINFEPTDARLL